MGWSLNPLSDISKLAGKALHAGEKVAEDGAKGFASAMKDAAKAVSQMSPSEIGHTALNVAGMIPVIGAPADAINAGWYAAQGDWKNAALSAATAIPGVGDLVGGARLGTTALKIAEDGAKIAEDGAKVGHAIKGAEAATKGGEGLAKTAKGAEKLGEKAGVDGVKTGDGAVKAGQGTTAKPGAGEVSPPGAETKPSGPKIHSKYADNTPVYEGQQPPRIKGPDPAAQGSPHSVLRYDPVNGRIYQAREYDGAGHPVRDVDFTNPTYPNGTVRPGHPGPPHQHRFVVNNPEVGPRSGFKRGGPEPMP